MLEPPVFDSLTSYGTRLGDAGYWRPYANSALADFGLSESTTMASGFEGTYPTLLGDRLVVKMFGYFPGWRESYETELTVNRAIEVLSGIAAPRVVAAGSLFPGRDHDWPFLIMERLPGRAWRDVEPEASTADSVAHDLGVQIRRLHDSPTEGLQLARGDWIAAHGGDALERHRTWGSLPDHLIVQLPSYLRGYRAGRVCLVHGDLTEDHLFIADGELLGIIDWGDAMITDPFYELGALHLGAFAGDRRILSQFLSGYGWTYEECFAERALQVALMHEFDLFGSFSDLAAGCSNLTALANQLWTPVN